VTAGGQYFNGNYVSLAGERPRLIATQAPLSLSKDRFWNTVWENAVNLIVMLCACQPSQVYWPPLDSRKEFAPGCYLTLV
jgi:protein tyrosine phosphatase